MVSQRARNPKDGRAADRGTVDHTELRVDLRGASDELAIDLTTGQFVDGAGLQERTQVWPAPVPDPRIAGPYERLVKPVLDFIAGIILSIATLPVVIMIVMAIWITMGRPAVFTQKRVGRAGRPFTVLKFRTMAPDRRQMSDRFVGKDRRLVHKTPHDPRITKVGAFLRKWSLDEIPQFWNVVLGQMSLVGPRPELVEIVETKYEPWQHRRHDVKPGITGLWQVSLRNGAEMHQSTEIDLEYLQSITFREDLRILLRTVPAALGHKIGS
jgi:lipopolysaccharide/colanic/teichoic acid biosynthesis glycosyltransferase